jgi:hypothetical protein
VIATARRGDDDRVATCAEPAALASSCRSYGDSADRQPNPHAARWRALADEDQAKLQRRRAPAVRQAPDADGRPLAATRNCKDDAQAERRIDMA